MNLTAFFAEIGPYLLGQRSHDETARRLYGDGDGAAGREAERLSIYGRFCGIHRREILESVYPYSHEATTALRGEAGWLSIVERYYVAHPMHHFEFNQNGIHFAQFVPTLVASGELPPFLSELADFEWWEWLTDGRLDEPADAEPEKGPLRLHSSVDLRPYGHDLITWIDDDEREPEAPSSRDNVVLFYRDPQLVPRRAAASGLDMLIIKAVVEEVPLDATLARQLGLPLEALQQAVFALREKGVLLGE
jgi:hypothetical protein